VLIRVVFGVACRDARVALDQSQQDLADGLGIHRGHLANIEAGRTNISVDLMDRIATRLGQRLELIVHPPRFIGARPVHDTVHAWCSGFVARRLSGAGCLVAREVDVSAVGNRGWIDILAFDPRTGTLIIVEIKTRLDDLGRAERQLGWYERNAIEAALRLGWRPRRVTAWMIVLASDEVERTLMTTRDAIGQAFPGRAPEMLATLAGSEPTAGRAIAMVDPASRRTRWLIRTRLDGRRSAAPYRDYADAVQRIPLRRR
jgi:transcriptional regulator with XRE-family HTH domain